MDNGSCAVVVVGVRVVVVCGGWRPFGLVLSPILVISYSYGFFLAP
jgi:hypothetical protein